ncbi:MAG: DUF1311 domain-containing protein [Ruminococcus sp.]|nr:DUF1311 domain-containing protein [Ruminococcus sp.]
MKRFISLILILILASTLLVGCGGKGVTPTKPEKQTSTQAPTVSEIDLQYETAQKYIKEKKYADAVFAFTKVLELDDSRVEVYIQRGDAYYELAQTENKEENLLSAVADYETAVSKDTKAEDTKLYECYVSLGENAVDTDQKYDALTYYKKAYEFDKSDPYVALMQKLWMYKEDDGKGRISYFTFDFDNTGYAFYNNVVGEQQTLEYTLNDNSLHMMRYLNIEYDWKYDVSKAIFTQDFGSLELVSAKEAFEDWYNNISESTSQYGELTTQADMTAAAGSSYDMWDVVINVVYDYVISVLPEDKASSLSSEQKDWISEKESAMESVASEYVGGSMYGMIKAQTGADYTKERVKELIDMIPEP